MGGIGHRLLRSGACVLALSFVPVSARAFEISGGLSAGGILAGTTPHFAVSPQFAVLWPVNGSFILAAQEVVNVLPPTHRDGPGVYEQTTVALGYAAEKQNFSIGPSFNVFAMPACGAKFCGRVSGVAPGGHAQVNFYFYGRLGVSANADLAWISGKSLVLPGGLAVTVVAGPVVRWSSEQTP